ncbi:MAG: ABC transporter substrate-binding protein [Desulfobacterales bacterium]
MRNHLVLIKTGIAVLLLLQVLPTILAAAEDRPVDRFKDNLRQALAIRYDPNLQGPERQADQKRQIWALVDAAFDEESINPLILRRTWPDLTPEARAMLHPAMGWAIKWKFIGKLYKYNVRDISFKEEGIEGDRYLLHARIGTGMFNHRTTFVFLPKNSGWVAVDIIVSGVSLIEHYRRKFDNTFSRSGLSGLMKHLADEVNEEFAEMGYAPATTP